MGVNTTDISDDTKTEIVNKAVSEMEPVTEKVEKGKAKIAAIVAGAVAIIIAVIVIVLVNGGKKEPDTAVVDAAAESKETEAEINTGENESTAEDDVTDEAEAEGNYIVPSDDFNSCLTDEGLLKGVTASEIVILPDDYESIEVPYSEIEYTDEEFNSEIQELTEQNPVLDTKTDKKIENGDKINLDYVGSVGGVEFSGGSTGGRGTNLVIGSGSYIPGFEDQIVGHKVGDNFDINVRFPDEYTAELAGKDAVFNITVNGIYTKAEFTDSYVKEKFPEYGKTVEEYREKRRKETENEKKKEFIRDYLGEHVKVTEYPADFYNHLKAFQKYQDIMEYEYMNQMYEAYGMQGADTFEDYVGMSEEEYDKNLDEVCKRDANYMLSRQAIAEICGISVSEDEMIKYVESVQGQGTYEAVINRYGKGYIAQLVLIDKVDDYLVENTIVINK